MTTCKGKRKDGAPCRALIVAKNGYCAAHQDQARPGAGKGQAGKAGKHTLALFVEENHRLLTVLGVFTALTVFANGLPLKALSQPLAFMFMALAIILWFEIAERFPSDPGATWRLMWFESILSFATLWVVLYWLVDFRSIWHMQLPVLLMLVLGSVALSVFSRVMKRHDVFNRMFGSEPGEHKRLRYLTWLTAQLTTLLVCGALALYIAKPLNTLLDGMYQELESGLPPKVQPTGAKTVPTRTVTPTVTPVPLSVPSPMSAAPTVEVSESTGEQAMPNDGEVRRPVVTQFTATHATPAGAVTPSPLARPSADSSTPTAEFHCTAGG